MFLSAPTRREVTVSYQVTAEQPSRTPGQKILLRVEYPSYTEAWLSMRRLTDDGWRITETPQPIGFPTVFPLERAA